MRLCAVFLAIFLPAALVALGCFFLPAGPSATSADFSTALDVAVAVLALPFPFGEPFVPLALVLVDTPAVFCWGGCICMILRERVGGGGNVKLLSLPAEGPAADERLRALTASAGCIGYAEECGDVGETWPRFVVVVEFVTRREADDGDRSCMAGGGSSNASCRDASFCVPS